MSSLGILSEGYWHYEDQYPSKIPSDDADDSKVLEDVHVPSKTTSIIEDLSVGSDTPIHDEGHTSYEGTSEVVNVIVNFGTLLIVDAHVHDTSDSAYELVESSVSSQISKYSFITPLIKD